MTQTTPPEVDDRSTHLTAGPEAGSEGSCSLDSGLVRAEVDHASVLNLAMAHNAVALVSAVRLTHVGERPLDELVLRLELKPGVSEPWLARVASLEPGQTVNFSRVDVPLALARLAGVVEQERAQLWLELDAAGETVLRCCHSVDVLPYNQWPGLVTLPQLLAAFVQPNHPAVARLLTRTRGVLERQTGDPALDDYQSNDPARVRAMVGALYGAVQELGVSYVTAPASFGHGGQKIRTPEQVLDQTMGTCLDLTVLLAACLEQMGLHPWLVLLKGHAFVGTWLTDERSVWTWTDDALQLLKLVELDVVMVLDATVMVERPQQPLARAESTARKLLGHGDDFVCAICVEAARQERIRPLPARIEEGNYTVVPEPEPRQPAATPPAAVLAAETTDRSPGPEQAPPAVTPRLVRWQEQLLDLSLRNRMLNFRETKKTLPLFCPDLAAMEDALALGRSFQLQPRPQLLGDHDPRDPSLLDARTGEDTVGVYLADQMQRGVLFCPHPPAELQRRQAEIARAARTSLEESGVSTLFLALGFLTWYAPATPGQPRRAPLILLPLELTRRTARDPFVLSRVDEEPQINVTLLEKLRKDFGVEIPELDDELPHDDAGLDISAIIKFFRIAILNFEGWHVDQQVVLGHFSFTKFLMWRDLTDGAQRLRESPVIQHLALAGTGDDLFADRPAMLRPEELDSQRHPATTFCPLDADSSQLSAVFAAEAGHTFVLQGPPGTGKSQTITNLISHCLAAGKTVLFVSEKMAALDVVHRRLRSVGLGEFCLELHSNKARKRQVLQRMGHSWDAEAAHPSSQWQRRADKLLLLRDQLNGYVEALHRKRQGGERAYDVIGRLMTSRDVPKRDLDLGDVEVLSGERLDDMREAVQRLELAAEEVGDPTGHPYRAVGLSEWLPGVQQRLVDLTRELSDSAGELADRVPACDKILRGDAHPLSADELDEHREMARLLLTSPGAPEGLLQQRGWSGVKAEVEGWLDQGQRRDDLRATLDRTFASDDLLTLDLPELTMRFVKWANAFFLFAFFALFFPRRTVRVALRPGQRLPPNRQLVGLLKDATELAQRQQALEVVDPRARQTLGAHWTTPPPEQRWARLRELVGWVDDFRRALSALVARQESFAGEGQRGRLLLLAADQSDVQLPQSSARRALEQYCAAHDRFNEARTELVQAAKLDEEVAWGDARSPDHLDQLRRWADDALARPRLLRSWCHCVAACDEANELALRPLVDAWLNGALTVGSMRPAFERSYAQWWAENIALADPALATFHGAEQRRRIDTFCELDRQLATEGQDTVRARLSAQLPDPRARSAAGSELAILRRELQKKTRHMPVRKLFGRIPSLLRLLKPCLLMSPLSVAQYLDPRGPLFDLVVFDEASQIPTHDAIGCLARARAAVVVGDTKQLPPTSFFARLADDEPDENDVAELESILDECVAAGLPSLRLGWHYRSKHESLIAFSNARYYDGELLTFPSVASTRERGGVSLVPVPGGRYDKGRTRTNRAEADAVVAEVVRRLSDPSLRRQSMGVVTFSMAQQRLIEELLEQHRKDHPEHEVYFGEAVTEPLFVKNLENVQGDERDVMLFSVCYGPDKNGNISMNFGPLNRTGGERRLNVAVTRARYQLLVFSTLRSDQIDLARTRSDGARDLKDFLRYAEHGPAAMAEAHEVGGQELDNAPFEEDLARAIERRGWQVHRRVGCSGYRIDLGISDPQKTGRYLLGVECDGPAYRSARCARDRDRLRGQVLRGLGWRLHRVWSSDYWHDPDRELELLDKALAEAEKHRADEPQDGAWSELSAESAVAPAPADDDPMPPEPWVTAGQEPTELPGEPYPDVPPAETYPDAANLDPDELRELLHAPRATAQLIALVRTVVQREAPIQLQLLTRRVLTAFGLKRVTQRSCARVAEVLAHAGAKQQGDFVWEKGEKTNNYNIFRRESGIAEAQRKAQEIPAEEAAAAALWVLKQNIALPEEALVRETAKLLGFARTGQQVRARMESGIALLEQRGQCRRSDERVELGDAGG